MKKEIASKLLIQLDFKTNEVLSDYANERIEVLNSVLQTSNDINSIKEAQGQIFALKQLINIRTLAQLVVDGDRNG